MEKSYDNMPDELKQWTIKQTNDLIYGRLNPMQARKMISLICTSTTTHVGDLICDIVTNEDAADADVAAEPS